jgi:hypothetical protein
MPMIAVLTATLKPKRLTAYAPSTIRIAETIKYFGQLIINHEY